MLNSIEYSHDAAILQEERKAGSPWHIFVFLFVLLAIATPYQFDFTVQQINLESMVDVAANGSLGRRLSLPVLAGYGLICIFRGRKATLQIHGIFGLSFLCFLAFAFSSLAWAEDPALTLRKLTVYFFLLIGAVGLAVRFSMREIVEFVCFVCFGVIVLSFGSEIVMGTFLQAREYSIYQFSGVMHPNATATSCFLSALSSFALLQMKPERSRRYLLMLAISLLFLLLTRSRTTFGASLIVIGMFWFLNTNFKQKVLTLIGAGVIGCSIALVFSDDLQNKVVEIALLGRAGEGTAGSLSRRLPLWQECLSFVEKKPLLGYGYDSFWTPEHIYSISRQQGWEVPHSHNGYLEMTLSLGLVGLLLYILVLGFYLLSAWREWMYGRNPAVLFGFGLICWFCLEMLLEKVHMSPLFPSFICSLMLARRAFVADADPQMTNEK